MASTIRNNTEFVTELMDFSRHGALMQAFVMEALEKWSRVVLDNQEQLRDDMKNSLVDAGAWIGCAEEIQQKLETRYA